MPHNLRVALHVSSELSLTVVGPVPKVLWFIEYMSQLELVFNSKIKIVDDKACSVAFPATDLNFRHYKVRL
jgi:hypothetical protein